MKEKQNLSKLAAGDSLIICYFKIIEEICIESINSADCIIKCLLTDGTCSWND